MMMPTRPVLRYHGGKWRLSPWIIQNLPPHRVYVEPYGGAASVLLRKPRSYAEVYNDLDNEITDLFRVLRDPVQAQKLIRLLYLTPYARSEFELSYSASNDDDPVERARKTVIRSFMGFGSSVTARYTTGFRNDSRRSGTIPAHDWQGYPDALVTVVERLRGVIIENRQALDVIRDHDNSQTLYYIDPPYPYEVRSIRWAGKAYRHEMTNDDHLELADMLHRINGMAVISGYQCQLYDDLYHDWDHLEHTAMTDGAHERVETLWLSLNCQKARMPLFYCETR